MSNIQIKTVKTKKEKRAFIKFPWKIYKDDPYWVPPLLMEVRDKLDKKRNPFFEHAETELFLAYKNGELVGRIAATIDDNHNQTHDEKIVFFGMFECIEDFSVAESLLDHAKDWGIERGMTILRGPANLSLNDECAFLVEGFDSPPTIMMPYNPPYYLNMMDQYGMAKAKDLLASLMKKGYTAQGKVQAIIKRIEGKTSVTLRDVDLKNIHKETGSIAHIYNEAWKDNWGFVAWTQKEMDHMAKNLKQFADPGLIVFAIDKGRPIGFGFGLPNYNEIFKTMNGRLFPFGIIKFLLNKKKVKGTRALVFGILKEYRNSGISYLIYSRMEKHALEAGYEWCETSWQLEDNETVLHFSKSLGGEVYKRYRIYEKDLSS